MDQIRSGGRGLSPEYVEAISLGVEIAGEKLFFHWDLEFPEAFVDLKERGWKAKGEQGFDAVVGNPPYDVLATKELGWDVSKDLAYFRVAPDYLPAVRGKINLYKLFICRGMSVVSPAGRFAYITPMALLGDDQARGVRRSLLEQTGLTSVESFPQKDDPQLRVFPEAKLSTTVFATRGSYSGLTATVRTHPGAVIEEPSPVLKVKPRETLAFDPENVGILSCTQRDWDIAISILSRNVTRLGDLAEFRQGEINETNQRMFLSEIAFGPEVIRGSSICMYTVREASQGVPLNLDVESYLEGASKRSKAWDHKYRRVGLQNIAPQNNFRRLIAAPIATGDFCFGTVNYVTEERTTIPLDVILALINSQVLDWYFRLGSTNAHVNVYQLKTLPVPIMSKEVVEEVSEMSRRIQDIEYYRVSDTQIKRSRLAGDAQPFQNAIDDVLFQCYGLSDGDARYIKGRLAEML